MKMKKTLSLLIAATMLTATFTSCKDKKDKKGTPESTFNDSASKKKPSPYTDLEPFAYNRGLDENGMWANIDAASLFTMFDYGNLQVPFDSHNVTDEEIEMKKQEMLQFPNSTELAGLTRVTDRAIAEGDRVNVDYVGTIDGEEFATESGFIMSGTGEVTDSFMAELIGHSPGEETFAITIKFPDDYKDNTELKGKEAVFNVDVNYIVADDELTAIAEPLVRKAKIESYFDGQILNTEVNIPDEMMKRIEKNKIEEYTKFAEQNSKTLDEYLAENQYTDGGAGAFLELIHENLVAQAKRIIVKQAIAQQLGITVTEDDIAAFLNVDKSELQTYIDSFTIEYLKQETMFDKVYTYVVEHAKLLTEAETYMADSTDAGGTVAAAS